jgi:hypothetical protein
MLDEYLDGGNPGWSSTRKRLVKFARQKEITIDCVMAGLFEAASVQPMVKVRLGRSTTIKLNEIEPGATGPMKKVRRHAVDEDSTELR